MSLPLPSPAIIRAENNHTQSLSSSEPAKENPFLRSMLEIPSMQYTRRSPLQMVASVLIHAGVIALLVIVPGYFVSKVIAPAPAEVTYVFTPPAPLPPPPAAAAGGAARQKVTAPTQPVFKAQPLEAPRMIPNSVVAANSPALSAAPDVGVLGGIPGGSADGVLGGIIGGTGTGPAAPVTSAVVRVGGDVKRPELLKRVEPEYPLAAKANDIQGTVLIDAVIDAHGNVVNEHAVDGPEALLNAALAAVEQWKYQPTYLNGTPVSLSMEVSVNFHLNS